MARDIAALVAGLDLDEKAALLAGADLWSTVAVPRLGIVAVGLTDGPNGARGQGLPGAMGGASTSLCLPSGSGLGASWDVELVERVGAVIGAEARMKACRVLLAPTVNLHRSPLGGRNFESYSEDPLLAGRLGAAFVRGAQGQGVACTVKHFAGNESEDGRMLVDTVVDERTLREVHLRPFELAVREGGALGVMTSYNRLNGDYCADSEWLLSDVLRREWGFDGFVVSDWFAFADTAKAIRAGLDLEMPGPGRAYGPALATLVREGGADEELVDAAAVRLLGVLDRIGALDDDPSPAPRSDDLPEHRAVARGAAAAATVLLRNDGVLPLDPGPSTSVAVLGPNAARAVIMGGGSASLPVPEPRTPLEALRDRLGPDVRVAHEPGVDIALTTPEVPGEWLRADGDPGWVVELFPLGAAEGEPVRTLRVASGSVAWVLRGPAGVDETFAWRARGELVVPGGGRYTLSLAQTEGAVLVLDGEVVIDGRDRDLPAGHDFFGMGRQEQTAVVELAPDRPVPIELRSQVSEPASVMGAKVGLRPALPVDAMERAVAAAAEADVVVLVVGTDGEWESEGHDRASMDLPGAQDELVERVLAVAPDAVVVLNAGSPVSLPWADRCRALLQCGFGGLEMAEALADVLLGAAEPGGRLPTTIPRRVEDNPSWGNFPGEGGRIRYGERMLVGHRWYDSRGIDVAFPFGHGLSYTDFTIGVPEVASSTFDPAGTLAVRVPVTNVGGRGGSEVVQLYVAPRAPGAFRPPRQLEAFAKVHLEPGRSATVELVLDGRSFARWADTDPAYLALLDRQAVQAPWLPPPGAVEPTGWVVDEGTYDLQVGRSSADIAHVVPIEVRGAHLGPGPRAG
jgi:beta-glucosidase